MIKLPLFPEYNTTITLLKILDGMPANDFKNMWNSLWGQRGIPQDTVDWTNPDEWIGVRLSGRDKEIVWKIWTESDKTVNPRWTRGSQFLMSGYHLVNEENGVYKLTTEGEKFISDANNDVVKKIDLEEGVIQILR